MHLHQLEVFQSVAKHRGFSRASAGLRLSQPAISINIKKLEEELGVELFERLGRSIQLTGAGRVVEEHVTRLMGVLSELRQAIDEIKGLEAGQFRCGAATTIGIYLLPKILVQFKKRFPKVETQFFSGRSSEIEKRVLSNDLDIGFVGSDLASSLKLRTHAFFTDELVMICPPNYYLARFRKVSPKQLSDLPLILGPKDSYTRKIIEKHLETAAIPYRCVMEVENTEVIKAAVSEGLGVSILSLVRIQREIKNGLLIPVRISGISIKRQFRIIMLKDKTLSGPLKAFLELLGVNGINFTKKA